MAYTYSTAITLKDKMNDALTLDAVEGEAAYAMAKAHRDIRFTNDGTETLVPWAAIGSVTLSVTEEESEAAEDEFCGGES